ncbi:hypothetical protein EV191_110211 [Tamaricihabitans halophyticus]|uniref:Uncharacterized protein n=1 Tax=Tamaricihabitans halophyticus TaxID=1262583 RepID=A0A4R2QHA8_9PSEU|nr:hypothetical protein [Tamaricihabitans halophyticus]TCP48650.1 hypothetical protein EV191_110211 [Tamaricihabitans halophyticus]
MSLFGRRSKSAEPDLNWYYCVRHARPERGDQLCKAIDRLGPYPDEETAWHALEIAKARTEVEDARDAAEADDTEQPGTAGGNHWNRPEGRDWS